MRTLFFLISVTLLNPSAMASARWNVLGCDYVNSSYGEMRGRLGPISIDLKSGEVWTINQGETWFHDREYIVFCSRVIGLANPDRVLAEAKMWAVTGLNRFDGATCKVAGARVKLLGAIQKTLSQGQFIQVPPSPTYPASLALYIPTDAEMTDPTRAATNVCDRLNPLPRLQNF